MNRKFDSHLVPQFLRILGSSERLGPLFQGFPFGVQLENFRRHGIDEVENFPRIVSRPGAGKSDSWNAISVYGTVIIFIRRISHCRRSTVGMELGKIGFFKSTRANRRVRIGHFRKMNRREMRSLQANALGEYFEENCAVHPLPERASYQLSGHLDIYHSLPSKIRYRYGIRYNRLPGRPNNQFEGPKNEEKRFLKSKCHQDDINKCHQASLDHPRGSNMKIIRMNMKTWQHCLNGQS